MPRRPIPDPVIVALQQDPVPSSSSGDVPQRSVSSEQSVPAADRPNLLCPDQPQSQIDDFLQSLSLSPKSQAAYRQDLQRFTAWTDTGWGDVTRKQMVLFRGYLLEEKQLAPATINRVLTTLKRFYRWLVESEHVRKNPTIGINLLTLEKTSAKELCDEEIAIIYQAVAAGKFPERDTALVSVLLHGLRATEVSALNLGDFDGTQLYIHPDVHPATDEHDGLVPLRQSAIDHLNHYLDWRQQRGARLAPTDPLFLSCSRRSIGQRLSDWGIRDVIHTIKTKTGIDLHAHRFRHTYAADLMQRGIHSNHVMMLTRHKSLQSVKQYTKPGSSLTARQAFYQAIGEKPPEPESEPKSKLQPE
jgi:integrase/recombinase XerD